MNETVPSVNLLVGRKKAIQKKNVFFAKVQFIAALVLLVYIGLVVAILLVRFGVKAQSDSLDRKIDEQTLVLAQVRPVEEKYYNLTHKLTLLSEFLAVRGDMKASVRLIRDTLPEGVELSSIGFEENNQIIIEARVQDVFVLRDFLTLVRSQVKDDLFRTVSLDGFSRGEDGVWMLSSVYAIGS